MTAVLEDASRLTLCEPAPAASGPESRVILLLDGKLETPRGTDAPMAIAWPDDLLGSIRVTHPVFTGPEGG